MKPVLYSIAIMLLFYGCKKVDQVFHTSKCKVITTNGRNDFFNVVAHFTYTSWGAPKAIQIEQENESDPSYFFHYNENHQLTAFLEGFTPKVGDNDTNYLYYHKYIYKNNIIIGDTILAMGNVKQPVPMPGWWLVGSFTYDHFGRIIKYVVKGPWFGEHEYVENYSYPNENPYIHNTNFLGTHPVLMFVGRNYYRTNQNVLTTNKFGLPTTFSKPYRFSELPIERIEYDCNNHHEGL